MKMLGSKGILTPLIPDCYVFCTLAILKNILLSEHFHPMKGRTSKKTGEKNWRIIKAWINDKR